MVDGNLLQRQPIRLFPTGGGLHFDQDYTDLQEIRRLHSHRLFISMIFKHYNRNPGVQWNYVDFLS